MKLQSTSDLDKLSYYESLKNKPPYDLVLEVSEKNANDHFDSKQLDLAAMLKDIYAKIDKTVKNLEATLKNYVNNQISANLQNYVTLGTNQIITGEKTFNRNVKVNGKLSNTNSNTLSADNAAHAASADLASRATRADLADLANLATRAKWA